MRYLSLWSAAWSTGAGPAPELMASLLELVPRVVVEGRGVVWADLGGVVGGAVAESVLDLASLMAPGDEVHAGLAAIPVAAELAARVSARSGESHPLITVEPGREREFIAEIPLTLLVSAATRPTTRGLAHRTRRNETVDPASGRGREAITPAERLLVLFEGVGLHTCGELAALDPASVEVRLGAEGVRLWHLARATDPRPLFPPIPPERPHASLDFIDYLVSDPERLIFTINALLESLLERLRHRGERARAILLGLPLADGNLWQHQLRPARPTSSRELWLRLVRGLLERVTLPGPVAGVALEVAALEPVEVRQGDLFDRGFATAGAVEAALARILEDETGVIVGPRYSGHLLPERRVAWDDVDPFQGQPGQGARGRPAAVPSTEPSLSLHLLPEPQPIDVEVAMKSDGETPARYRDRAGWHHLDTAAGPDRVSGGQWEEEPWAREYFRCITHEGALVWLFRDARRDTWFLHGWWG